MSAEELQSSSLTASSKKTKEKKTKEKKEKLTEACSICCDTYTHHLRKKVICPYCKAHACMVCQKTYITSSIHSAHCMSCKVAWNDDFLRDSFSNSWLTKDYAQIEINQLYELEKSLMPETLLLIEKEKMEDQFFSQMRPALLQKCHQLQNMLTNISESSIDKRYFVFQNVYNLVKQWNELEKSLKCGIENIDEETIRTLFLPFTTDKEKQQKTRNHFTKPCPAPDCRGFLSSGWKCGMCQTKVCPDCHVIKRLGDKKDDEKQNEVDGHKCKLEDVETAKLLAKDSKNCPKCGVSIFRISGCDQMFCTNCNTAFHWKTLTIINKGIHNPHYFQWLNQQNGTTEQIQNNEGGRECNPNMMQNFWNVRAVCSNKFPKSVQMITAFYRSILHINDQMNRQQANRYTNQTNVDIRLKYLKHQLTEDQLKSVMYARHKRQKFITNVNTIHDMLYVAAASIINSIPSTASDQRWNTPALIHKMEAELKKQIRQLTLYYNECITKFHQKYKSHAHFELLNEETYEFYRVNIDILSKQKREHKKDEKEKKN